MVGSLNERLKGFEVKTCRLDDGGSFRSHFPTNDVLLKKGITERAVAICTSTIEYEQSPYPADWTSLRNLLSDEQWKECKVTIPSPLYQHIQLKPGHAYQKSVYANDNEYFDALAGVWQREFNVLYEAGVRNIQIDDPNLTYFCTEQFEKGCVKDGIQSEELLDSYIRTHNKCLEGRLMDLHVGIHLCRGNFTGSTRFAEGSYEKIARKLFQDLEYDTFYLEYDSDRAGDFTALRHLPEGKNVVLGVVSTKTTELESLEALKKRVLQAASIIAEAQGRSQEDALDDMAVSPQCGFSSASLGGGVGVTMEIMWKKLELVRDLANEIWPTSDARPHN